MLPWVAAEGLLMEWSRTLISRVRTVALVAACALVLIGAFGLRPALAADPPGTAQPATMSDEVRGWMQRLDFVERQLGRFDDLTDQSREIMSRVLQEVSDQAKTALAEDTELLGPLRTQIDSLGAPPAEGQPAEAPDVAALRQELQDRLARIQGRNQTANLVLVRVDELKKRVSLEETGLLLRLAERSPSLFDRSTWRQAGRSVSSLVQAIAIAPAAWWEAAQGTMRPVRLVIMILAALLAAALVIPVRLWLLRRLSRPDLDELTPTTAERTARAAMVALAQVMLPCTGLGVLAATIYFTTPYSSFLAFLLVQLSLSGMIFFAIWGLARAVLSPEDHRWRILPVTEEGAQILSRRVLIVAIYVAIVGFVDWTAAFGEAPTSEFLAVERLLTNSGGAALILWLLPGRFWSTHDRPAWELISVVIRGTIALCVISAAVMSLAGYSALADFLLDRLLATILGVGAAVLLRIALRELMAQTLPTEGRFHPRIDRWVRLSDAGARLTLFWGGLLIDLVVFGSAAYLLLNFYGFPTDLLNLWLEKLLTGIPIGTVTISLVDLILAIAVFVTGLLITGWIRRRLVLRFLPQTRMTIGARDAIASGVSYVGITIAMLVAIATIGLDLSNLALIASALSVGIGFGLRTVVENFVAGLLLLIERPIQSGDWVVAGDKEGTVKRISVRSTEIETFDRATVIVPNSELISQSVQNWTHKDTTVRVIISVGVAYGSDTEKVSQCLLACAEAHEKVLRYPEPRVVFLAFGASSLDFQLRCFIPNANERLTVTSELNFAVDAAFREAGIEIAFPQLDLHVRDANLAPAGENTQEISETPERTETEIPQIGKLRQ